MPTMPTIRNLQAGERPAKRSSNAVARVRSILRRTPVDVHEWPSDVTIRAALPADAVALSRLAALDEHPPIAGDVLVAEVGGELWAAAGIDEAAVIADPFRPSGDLALLLAERAGRVRRSRRTALRPRRAGRPAGQAA
jgi:hypothetical protein